MFFTIIAVLQPGLYPYFAFRVCGSSRPGVIWRIAALNISKTFHGNILGGVYTACNFIRKQNLPHILSEILQLLCTMTYMYEALKGQWAGADILVVTWCCHIWNQYGKPFSTYSFSIYHVKAVSATLMIPPNKQTLLSNTLMEEKIFNAFLKNELISDSFHWTR